MLEIEKLRAMEHYLVEPPTTRLKAAGRRAVLPPIDLDRYRFRFTLDRIQLEVHLRDSVTGAAGTTFSAVQGAIKAAINETVRVIPLSEGEGSPRSSLRFTLNLQDPTHARINAVRDALEERFGLKRSPSVVELELALDLFPVNEDSYVADRAIAARLLRTHLLPDIDWRRVDVAEAVPRLCRGKGKQNTHFLSLSTDIGAPPSVSDYPEATMYFGKRGDPVEWRVYQKTRDRVVPGVSAVTLAQERTSARAEATVRQGALRTEFGISTVTDLTGTKLRRLHRLFRFVIPTVPEWRTAEPGFSRNVAIWVAYRELNRKFYERGACCVSYERASQPRYAGSRFLGMATYEEARTRSSVAFSNFQRTFFK